jgi:hypothetical protein
MCAFLGLGYVFAYLGFVLLVPILLLAAAMLAAGKTLFASQADGKIRDAKTP